MDAGLDGGALRYAIGAWVLVVGAALGSFLNVVVARIPAGESIVRPGSRCPGCRAPIAWYDNLPVVSWLVLRGRCRRCGMAIPVRYPALELAGAAAAFLAWSRHGLSPAALAELALVDTLLALALIDLATWLLPHVLTWPLIALGLVAGAAGAAPAATLRGSAIGAAVGFAAFALVAAVGKLVTKKEALGFGDVWLLAGLGAWLGAPALLPVVLLASVQGSVYGLALVALGRSEPGPAEEGTASGDEKPSTSTTTTTSTTTSTTATATPTPTPTATATATTTATTTDDEDDWIPPRHAVPFGPFLVAGALEWLYLGGAITSLVPALSVFR